MAKKFDLVAIGARPGASAVASRFRAAGAGRGTEEVINLFAVAMRSGMPASDLKQMLFAHPTHGSNLPYMLKECPGSSKRSIGGRYPELKLTESNSWCIALQKNRARKPSSSFGGTGSQYE